MRERVILTVDEAVALLPEGDIIHAIRNPNAGMLIGADWIRHDVLAAISEFGAELSGPIMARMNHGIVSHVDGRPLFIATEREALEAFESRAAIALAKGEKP